ncbi:sugar phosphate isomerase/epimerase [Sinirhodobacter populi]|uniref:Sugar phosphate isomerase/epimerase n=1 Tax=Paenirhodobacter populi TaxID=2306993 RepID=A0A443K9B3_9RHOB|nr:sugar phosphate isomerase/epimerase family protein [Sinirhodobacter populi]RWR29292.1 sugar phosphate isomerase/epimerase [Sinirhodobacter populi]
MQFPIGVNTISDTWTVPLEESLVRLSKMGFRQFDVMVSPAHIDVENMTSRDYARIRRLLDAEGLTIHALTAQSLDHNLASPREEIREMTVNFNKKLLNACYELGAQGFVSVSGRYNALNAPPREQLEGWLRGSLEKTVRYAERAGAKVFLENVPMGVLPDARSMVKWVEEINSPALSLCYDLANAHFINEDLTEAIPLVVPYLDMLHMSDTGQQAWRHDAIGTGSVDFKAAAEALAKAGYKGLSIVEILSPEPDRAVAEALEKLAPLGWGLADETPLRRAG